jgi:hypothetical protein
VATRVKRSYSPNRVDRILRIDGRSAIAQAMRAERDALMASLPHPVSPTDAALVERAVIGRAHLLALDAKALAEGLSASEIRFYQSASSGYGRLLRQLKAAKAARPTGPSLAEIFAEDTAA